METQNAIRILSDQTINKIAAGEVIENSASVIKELVENSIDAGSTIITVEIRAGGRQLIRVTDNGCGMSPDDALLCLQRHATSKICEVEDIEELITMGFRGEAIPSIASISKFMLLTCPKAKNETIGTLILVDGGKIVSSAPAARSPGTTIEVKSLFFNVPVRQKFQRSPSYDAQEVLKMLSLLALGHPSVQFTLISDEKQILNTSLERSDSILASRVKSVLGKDFFNGCRPLFLDKEPFRVEGYIGDPSFTRNNKTGQYLFINHRAVQSPFISFCMREAYGSMLPHMRYPVFVLHLHLPGSMIDVNVHPQKKEVRLRQEQEIKELLYKAVQESLQDGLSPPEATLSNFQPSYNALFDHPKADKIIDKAVAPQFNEFAVPYRTFPTAIAPAVRETALEIPLVPAKKQLPVVLSTIKGFILVEPSSIGKPEGICLIDQKAASTRIHFERLMAEKDSSLSSQILLTPIILEFTPTDSALIKDHVTLLSKMGISIQEFGIHSFSIESLPPALKNDDLKNCLLSILHDFSQLQNSRHLEKTLEKQLIVAAGRLSLPSTTRLSLDEAKELSNQLVLCETTERCPRGKPIFLHLSSQQLEQTINKL